MKALKLFALVPLVLLSATTFAEDRRQGSYGSRSSYNDRDHGRQYDYDGRDRYRGSGRRYTGSRYSYSYVAPYGYYSRPSGLSIGLYDDYGYASYGYRDYGYGYGYYPPVRYRVYRPAPVLSLRLNIGGRGGRHRRR